MRIVAVQTGLEADSVLGGEITDREFLTRLADRGVEIHVLATEGHPVVKHSNIFPHYYRRGFYRKVPHSANLDVARTLRTLLSDLGKVDWVRFNSPYSVGIGTVASANGHRVWGSYLHCEDYLFWRWTDSWLPKRCDLITCLSDDTRQDIVARCPQADHSRNIVLPVGIDTQRVERVSRTRSEVREQLGVSDGDTLILFVGVSIPRKGIGDLTAAWEKLRDRRAARLLIVSKPVAEHESLLVAQLAKKDPRVTHLEKVAYEDVPAYCKASDIFFFPTHREGFGIVVGEAMACGLPVVTTRAKGVRGVVAENETALLADVGDVDQLARSLEKFIGDPDLRHRFGDAGKKRISELFCWDSIIDSLIKHLQA